MLEITVIKCETCNEVMAAWHDAEDAHEIAAYEQGHYCSENGIYECNSCNDARFAEGMRMAEAYDREMAMRGMLEDDLAWRDELLAAADLAFDTARDRGEI